MLDRVNDSGPYVAHGRTETNTKRNPVGEAAILTCAFTCYASKFGCYKTMRADFRTATSLRAPDCSNQELLLITNLIIPKKNLFDSTFSLYFEARLNIPLTFIRQQAKGYRIKLSTSSQGAFNMF